MTLTDIKPVAFTSHEALERIAAGKKNYPLVPEPKSDDYRSCDIGLFTLSQMQAVYNAKLVVTPEAIAAAWDAWKSRHGGKLGPGPAFAEAIAAAIRSLKGEQG